MDALERLHPDHLESILISAAILQARLGLKQIEALLVLQAIGKLMALHERRKHIPASWRVE